MSEPELEIIYNKDNIIIKKSKINTYHLLFSLQNPNMYLGKIVNFKLLDALYALNGDIFDDYKLNIHNENEATVYFLFKHFLRDLGLPQKYTYINLGLEKNNNFIQFKAETIQNTIPEKLPENVELLVINNINIDCVLENQHKLSFQSMITIHSKIALADFLEKFALKIFSRIFLRIKQFIENYK